MSTLDILPMPTLQEFDLLAQEWSDGGLKSRMAFPVDSLSPIEVALPLGEEKAALREIVKEARMKKGLPFRFWWAVKRDDGMIALQISFATVQGFDSFLDICDKYSVSPKLS